MKITPEIQQLIDQKVGAALARERAIADAVDRSLGGDSSRRTLARRIVGAQFEGQEMSEHGGYKFLMDGDNPKPLDSAIADFLSTGEAAQVLSQSRTAGGGSSELAPLTDEDLLNAFADFARAPSQPQPEQSEEELLDAFEVSAWD